ncbi:MAG: 16S rRNA (cytidine(1402)-2'-O)-methyltransferase [Bacteroidetes bacterium]|nr:16S rRNA (cytidine(1402)-2'-O)-methyltransferase [Bacteroidota bacterium]MBU1421853.1 16S rRNA (cytidine(1402)-2'-O)-methyltransferase [Bacteroidota bacterium]
MSETIQPGTLYLVATPIGNLEDITYRAVKILTGVDLIAAEDTRKTKILLDHYNIQKEMVSYFAFNEAKRTPELIQKLKQGLSIAIVSDAGTPGISDPAYRLVRAAIDEGINIISIPGASAFISALIVSGLSTDSFVFEGFLPHKKGRKTKLEQLAKETRTIILYESPHRLLRTLSELLTFMGDRRIVVAREITKKFEEIYRGKISNALNNFSQKSIKGEFVLIIGTQK